MAISQEVLTDILDLNDSAFESPAFIDFAAGNEMIPNSIMLSHRYGGHQDRGEVGTSVKRLREDSLFKTR